MAIGLSLIGAGFRLSLVGIHASEIGARKTSSAEIGAKKTSSAKPSKK